MSNKNEVFEYLIDQLRQQVNNNQCEDLAQEVQSLKNQLRDASAQIKELHLALVRATGDAEAYKLIRKQEQSGCCYHYCLGCGMKEVTMGNSIKIRIVIQELKEDGVLTTYSNGHVEIRPYLIDENGEEYVEMFPDDIELH